MPAIKFFKMPSTRPHQTTHLGGFFFQDGVAKVPWSQAEQAERILCRYYGCVILGEDPHAMDAVEKAAEAVKNVEQAKVKAKEAVEEAKLAELAKRQRQEAVLAQAEAEETKALEDAAVEIAAAKAKTTKSAPKAAPKKRGRPRKVTPKE